MSTVFSTLVVNSFNTTGRVHEDNHLLPVPKLVNVDKFKNNYKFGIDGNRGYASLTSDYNRDAMQISTVNDSINNIRTKQLFEDKASNKEEKVSEVTVSNVSKKENSKPKEITQIPSDIVAKARTTKVNKKRAKNSSNSSKNKKVQKNISQEVEKVATEPKPISSTIVNPDKSTPNTKVVNGQTYTIKKTISGGNATAYSIYGKTSTGCITFTSDDYYCVAVDPKQIPYYSDILIEFSDGKIVKGKAVDTGSALKSHYKGVVVDLYMKSEAECRKFGRRNVTVYVV